MPYGSSNTYGISVFGTTKRYSSPGVLGSSVTWGTDSPTFNVIETWNRSGTNTPKTTLKAAPKAKGGYRYELKAISVPRGPRLPYKVWVPRLQRHVWARKPITVFKYVKVKSKVRKVKGMDLKPNSFSFTKAKQPKPGPSSAVGTHADGTSYVVSGLLWGAIRIGLKVHGPSVQGYLQNANGAFTMEPFQSIISKLDNAALSSLREKIKNQSVNLGTVFAERAQTASMIGQGAVRIAQALLQIKKGRLLAAASTLFPTTSKKLANDVLLLQYGIKPMLSDIDGMAKHLAEEEKVEWQDIAVKSETLDEWPVYTDGTPGRGIATVVTCKAEIIVKYKAKVRMTGPSYRTLGRLGMLNPAMIAWEVIPFSFIIDWLIPIGNWLNTLDAFTGLKLVHAHKTYVIKRKYTFRRTFNGEDNSGYTWGGPTQEFESEQIAIKRTVLTDLAIPVPTFKNPVSGTHIVNALALLRQLKR